MDKIKTVTSHKKLAVENEYLGNEVKPVEKENNVLKNKNLSSSQTIESINRYFKDFKTNYDNKFDLMLRELRKKSEVMNELVDKMKGRED